MSANDMTRVSEELRRAQDEVRRLRVALENHLVRFLGLDKALDDQVRAALGSQP